MTPLLNVPAELDRQPLGPGPLRVVTPEFAEKLSRHIAKYKRGYATWLAKHAGCSRAMVSRIKDATIVSSEFVEPLAILCGIELPPVDIGPDGQFALETLRMAANTNETLKRLLMDHIRSVRSALEKKEN